MEHETQQSDSGDASIPGRTKEVRSSMPSPAWVGILWAVVTLAVFTAAGSVFHFPSSLPPNNGEQFYPAGINGAIVNGLGTGILIGAVQLLVLRRAVHVSWRWIAASAAAFLLIHAVGDVFPDSLVMPVEMLPGGLLLGGLQWWALRFQLRQGLWWTACTTVSWAVGLLLGMTVTAGMADWRMEHILVGLFAGATVGMGCGLFWLRHLSGKPFTGRRAETAPAA